MKGRRWTYWWPAVSFLQKSAVFVTLKLPLKIRSNCKCTHMHARTFSDWWLVMGVFLSSEWGEEGSQREERLTAPLGPLKSSCLQKWWKVKDEICVCVCTHVRLVWCFGLISKSLQPTLILKLIHMQNICLRWWDREDPRSRPDEFRHTHTHTHTLNIVRNENVQVSIFSQKHKHTPTGQCGKSHSGLFLQPLVASVFITATPLRTSD